MWSDNETDIDFLNFDAVATTVAEIIVQENGRPISIGVSGRWGVGKSSMVKLIRNSLLRRGTEINRSFLIVEFNAWLYQGYDDVRAALMEVIGTELAAAAQERKTGVTKAKEFLGRVDWFRAAKVAGSIAGIAAGIPPVALISETLDLGRKLAGGQTDERGAKDIESAAEKIGAAAKGILKAGGDSSPPKEIHALRKCFEEVLEEMNVTLVVLIDDLDRCLPETTISTLEAIRLFLFLKSTAFVIAADNEMIKHAVSKHFEGVGDDLITSYFDKLIQIPIRVPPLGTQEVRAYLILLFVQNSTLEPSAKDAIRSAVSTQLSQIWQGKRVDRAFLQTLGIELPVDLVGQLDRADRIAPLMTKASGIQGNPRLIKRFLNALAIRMAISKAHGVGVDEAALAKLLLFERCGNASAYAQLVAAASEDPNGRPQFLAAFENQLDGDEALKLEPPWDGPFVEEWLSLPPRLGDVDLRGALYVSREHAPLISPEDRLSSEGAELLAALIEHPEVAEELLVRLQGLPRSETAVIMDRLLERARTEQEWGVPAILNACLTLTVADASQGTRLAAFLRDRPASQIRPNIVPKISDQPWAESVFAAWERTTVIATVKAAMTRQRRR